MANSLRVLKTALRYALRSTLPGPRARRVEARRYLVLGILHLLFDEITFRRSGFLWTGSPACYVTRMLFVRGHHQDDDLASVIPWLQENTDFSRPFIVNVGANIGDSALFLSKTGKHVIAIEPNPATFRRLERNVRQNGLQGAITCCQLAVSDVPGDVDLLMVQNSANSEIVGEGGKVGLREGQRIMGRTRVKAVPLDYLLDSLGVEADKVALVVSDTQGFESHVVRSGKRLWAAHTPLWVEVWPKGLDCHGGTADFFDICKQSFTTVLRCNPFDGEAQRIETLEHIAQGLAPPPNDFADMLLL